MQDCVLFIPLTKVDEEKRLVYGLVSEEIVDQQNEIFDYDSSKPYFEEWSGRIEKATNGMSLGNVRLMHQPVIAGKFTQLGLDDDEKQVSCCAKVVDDHSWDLVLQGCLSGFSVGGKYVRRWAEKGKKGVTRFTVNPVEVSLVDNPAVPTATFQVVKVGGTTELRKFHSGEQTMEPTQEMIAAKAAELAKSAGTPDASEQFLEEAKLLLQGEMQMVEAGKAAAGEGGGAAAAEGGEGEATAGDGVAAGVAEGTGTGTGSGEGGTEAGTEAGKDASGGLASGASEQPGDQAVDGDVRKARRKEIGATLTQVWQAPDGRTFATKDAGIDALEGDPEKEESPVEKALREARQAAKTALGEGGEAEPATIEDIVAIADQLETMRKGLASAEEHLAPLLVRKGIYEVRSLLTVLQELSYLVSSVRDEAQREGDGSEVPAQIFAATAALGRAAVAMAQEEVAEMLTLLGAGSNWADAIYDIPGEVVAIVELSAAVEMTKANGAIMAKAGARHNKTDAQKIQAVHDHSVELGAKCAMPDKAAGAGGTEDDDVVKALRDENEGLKVDVSKAVGGIEELRGVIETLSAKVEKFGKQPEPLPPRADHIVVDRNGQSQKITQADLEKMSPDERVDLAIRITQMHGVNVGGRPAAG